MTFENNYIMTKEHKDKIGNTNKKNMLNKIKLGIFVPNMKGKHHTKSTKILLSYIKKGKLIKEINKEKLEELYIKNKMSALKCAKYFNCSENCIVNRLKQFKIKQRTKSESKIKELNPMFNKHPHNYGRTAENYLPQKNASEKQRITLKRLYKEGNIKHFIKGKTFEQFYGNRAIEIKNKSSQSHKDYINKNPSELERLKELRKNLILPVKDTKIEVKIQNFLTRLRIEYLAHKYINIEHAYQCDIIIPSMNIVIECDGDYWHGNPNIYSEDKLSELQKSHKEKDKIRTQELQERGFRVIRLWESDIKAMDLNKLNTIIQLD